MPSGGRCAPVAAETGFGPDAGRAAMTVASRPGIVPGGGWTATLATPDVRWQRVTAIWPGVRHCPFRGASMRPIPAGAQSARCRPGRRRRRRNFFIPAGRGHYRVIVPDLLGAGRSDRPDAPAERPATSDWSRLTDSLSSAAGTFALPSRGERVAARKETSHAARAGLWRLSGLLRPWAEQRVRGAGYPGEVHLPGAVGRFARA
jgi:hypothetical protein